MGAPRKLLWELVHSLTASESMRFYERAFQAKRGGYPAYVALFDAIKKQNHFDDQELRMLLKGHQFANHLTRIKNYLYNKILDFVPGDSDDKESELSSRISRIKFLFEKRLYRHLPEQIEAAVSIAEEMEDFLSHMRILHYERERIRQEKNWNEYSEKTLEIKNTERSLFLKQQQKLRLNHLRDDLLVVPRIGGKMKTIENIKHTLGTEKEFLSDSARIIALQIRFFIAHNAGSFSECINVSDSIIEIVKSRPAMLQDYGTFRVFVMSIFYGAMFRVYFNLFNDAEKLFQELVDVADAENREVGLYFERKILFELSIGRRLLDEKRVASAFELHELLSKKSSIRLDPSAEIEILHLKAISAIIFESPKSAIPFLTEILTIKPLSARPDIRHFSRLLMLVVHHDLGNLDVVEDGIRSARIAFKRRKIDNGYYRAILQLFSQIVKAKELNGRENAFRVFLDGFSSSSGDQKRLWDSMNNYFNFRAWSRAKLEGIPMKEVLSQEFNI